MYEPIRQRRYRHIERHAQIANGYMTLHKRRWHRLNWTLAVVLFILGTTTLIPIEPEVQNSTTLIANNELSNLIREQAHLQFADIVMFTFSASEKWSDISTGAETVPQPAVASRLSSLPPIVNSGSKFKRNIDGY